MSFNKSDYNYFLPQDQIAQKPAEPRDHSRMMVLNTLQKTIEHNSFFELPDIIAKDSILVLNDTKVIPARLLGNRDTGAQLEVLLVQSVGEKRWECKVKNATKLKTNEIFNLCNEQIRATLLKRNQNGHCILEFDYEGDFFEILNQHAFAPIPPYIHKARLEKTDRNQDLKTYQTVYAQDYGAIAAPTAGLHFTDEIIQKLTAKGVEILTITLHVGIGTFEPIRVADIRQHQMHFESYAISEEVATKINQAKFQNRKIVAVGTTSVRTLESAWEGNKLKAGTASTNIFIYPPYQFKVVDQLLTNFHLPESTLLMLISAFSEKDFILEAYQTAVDQKYRFFSYGDCMFIS